MKAFFEMFSTAWPGMLLGSLLAYLTTTNARKKTAMLLRQGKRQRKHGMGG